MLINEIKKFGKKIKNLEIEFEQKYNVYKDNNYSKGSVEYTFLKIIKILQKWKNKIKHDENEIIRELKFVKNKDQFIINNKDLLLLNKEYHDMCINHLNFLVLLEK